MKVLFVSTFVTLHSIQKSFDHICSFKRVQKISSKTDGNTDNLKLTTDGNSKHNWKPKYWKSNLHQSPYEGKKNGKKILLPASKRKSLAQSNGENYIDS